MNKKGIALVIAIIVLLGLSLMATAIMLTTQSEMKIGAAHKWYVEAMDVAQAGINEVIHRMKLSDTDANYIGDPNSTPDPNWEAVILDKTPPPAAIGDTTFYSSVQYSAGVNPVLEYSDTAITENALKIHYKHKGNQIYFYDQKHQREILGDPSLIDVYYPIIMVEVTGRYGTAKRKVNTEIVKYSIVTNIPSGLAASSVALNVVVTIFSSRDVRVDGHVCKPNTPWWTVPSTTKPDAHTYEVNVPFLGYTPSDGFGQPFHWTYETNAAGDTELYHVRRFDNTFHPETNMEYNDECGKTGCIPGIVTPTLVGGGLVGIAGSNDLHVYGNPDILLDPNFTTPKIWELLGFKTEADMNDNITWTTVNTQGDFDNLMYTNSTDADNHDPQFIKVDNAGFTLNLRNYGRGVLWVTGDAYTSRNDNLGTRGNPFGWKGIVYVGGDLILYQSVLSESNTWILGTIAVEGDVRADGTIAGGGVASGQTFYIIYSPKVINSVTDSRVGRFIILNWREIK